MELTPRNLSQEEIVQTQEILDRVLPEYASHVGTGHGGTHDDRCRTCNEKLCIVTAAQELLGRPVTKRAGTIARMR